MQAFPTSPQSPTLPLRLQGFLASSAVVMLSCAAYRYAPFAYQRKQFGELYGMGTFRFTGEQFLFGAAALYIVLLAAFFTFGRAVGVAKATRFVRIAAAFVGSPARSVRQGLAIEDRVAVLATVLKMFFAPMMTMSLMIFCNGSLVDGRVMLSEGALSAGVFALLERHNFWFFMQVILFIDVSVFTFGYLIELPRLGNEIRSVDPSWLGWTAALLCYPPFNTMTGLVLGSTVSDFPRFESPTLHVALNALLLGLMAIYASASVALGWKASNLTHRGIIARGPYAVIRHPAYICKNMAWWISSFPLMGHAFGVSTLDGVQALASMAAWTTLYVLRALTEEDHLKRVDDEYATYAARVRYRFIPGLL